VGSIAVDTTTGGKMAELSEKARKLFEDPNFLFVATINADGSPQVTPVWTALDNDHITFNTAVGRVKERNLRRDPRVGLSITAWDSPMEKVDVRCRVVDFIEGDEAYAQIDDLAEKYIGQRPYPWLQESEKRVKIVIEPVRVHER
jgi:PPOX class probable F420-dependent enzyme